jgi:cysteine desulfurase
LERSRARCAAVLGTVPENLYFTSGGTEANALVLHSLLLRRGSGSLLYSAAEHPSVRENAESLSRLGKKVLPVEVEADGGVSRRGLRRALEKAENPRMAAIMGVNNETGRVTDIPALAGVLREAGGTIHLHCDLVQQAGKLPLGSALDEADSAAFSAHKLGGPRSVGLLFLRRPLEALYAGGGQERGLRPGTENVDGAAALADCLERRALPGRLGEEEAALRWKALITGLRSLERCTLIPADRQAEDPRFSPWILQLAFDKIPGEVMVRALDEAGFAASTGSACSSAKQERPVLSAMGLDPKTAFEGFRLSQGWSTEMEDIEALLEALQTIAKKW